MWVVDQDDAAEEAEVLGGGFDRLPERRRRLCSAYVDASVGLWSGGDRAGLLPCSAYLDASVGFRTAATAGSCSVLIFRCRLANSVESPYVIRVDGTLGRLIDSHTCSSMRRRSPR